MSSGNYFYVFPPRSWSRWSEESGMCRVRPDNGVNILSATPCTARHALSALIDSKNVIRSKFHLTFDTTRTPKGPPAPLYCRTLCQLSSLFGKCQCVQCELGPTRANHGRAVPTWGAYGGGGQSLKHSIYKPNWSINTHSNWPINWILMRSVNPNNETHPARWWWIPCWFHKLSDNQFIYVDSKLRIQLKFKGNFKLEPKVYNNLQNRETISQKLFELFTNTCTNVEKVSYNC